MNIKRKKEKKKFIKGKKNVCLFLSSPQSTNMIVENIPESARINVIKFKQTG